MLKETSQSRPAIIAETSRRTVSFYISYMRILFVYLVVILFLCLAISQERSILLLNESLNRGGITPGRNLYSLLVLLYILPKYF